VRSAAAGSTVRGGGARLLDQGLLGQIEGRAANDAIRWLEQRKQCWLDAITIVAIDMSAGYVSAIRQILPHATVVVDHFHVVQLANKMLALVRRAETVKARGRRGRTSDPEYGIRNRLQRNREEVTEAKFADMWNKMIDLGEPGVRILTAYIAKEELRKLLACAKNGAGRFEISTRLTRFYQWCADSGMAEVQRLARTVDRWWPGILAFLTTGVTNAGSEGNNRLIKLEARNAFGFRNPVNQRLRSRSATTRLARHCAKNLVPSTFQGRSSPPTSGRAPQSRRPTTPLSNQVR
jgi:transposase